jgi:4-alpha-glucanotransferase
MITDVFGESIRFNTPGTLRPDNWTPRLPWTVKDMAAVPGLLAMTETYARLAREAERGATNL